MNIKTFMSAYLYIFAWKDSIEIFFIASVAYTYLHFLNHHQLIHYKYYWYGLMIITYIACIYQLEAIVTVTPFLYILLIITTIIEYYQKYKPTINSKIYKNDGGAIQSINWIEILMQSMLHIPAKKLPIAILIEKNDPLHAYLENSCILTSPINKDLLSIIFESEKITPSTLLQITHTGIIKSIMVSSLTDITEYSCHETLLQKGIVITHATDALMIIRTINQHDFTIIKQGSYIENLTIMETIRLLKKIYYNALKKESDIDGALKRTETEKILSI